MAVPIVLQSMSPLVVHRYFQGTLKNRHTMPRVTPQDTIPRLYCDIRARLHCFPSCTHSQLWPSGYHAIYSYVSTWPLSTSREKSITAFCQFRFLFYTFSPPLILLLLSLVHLGQAKRYLRKRNQNLFLTYSYGWHNYQAMRETMMVITEYALLQL